MPAARANPVQEDGGVNSGVANIGTTFLRLLGAGGEPGTSGGIYARSSSAAGDSAPASSREVGRCGWKDMLRL